MPGGRPPTSKNRTPFGQRLHAARIEAGLSQTQLAHALGVTQPSYADWERSAVSLKPEYLPKLAQTLGVSVEALLGVKEQPRTGGPAGKLRQVFERASKLPREQQKHVMRVIEDTLTAYQVRQAI